MSFSTASGQLQIQHEHRTTALKQTHSNETIKSFHVRFKHKFLTIYVDLYTVLAPDYQIFCEAVGLERSPLRLVRITEELFRGNSGSGLENRN
jgi:hypothetical protein